MRGLGLGLGLIREAAGPPSAVITPLGNDTPTLLLTGNLSVGADYYSWTLSWSDPGGGVPNAGLSGWTDQGGNVFTADGVNQFFQPDFGTGLGGYTIDLQTTDVPTVADPVYALVHNPTFVDAGQKVLVSTSASPPITGTPTGSAGNGTPGQIDLTIDASPANATLTCVVLVYSGNGAFGISGTLVDGWINLIGGLTVGESYDVIAYGAGYGVSGPPVTLATGLVLDP